MNERTSTHSSPETDDQASTLETPRPPESIIEAGIAAAREQGREIDLDTAMRIGEALARAVDEDGALARFGNTGVGSYPALREEYLEIYGEPETPAEAKRWIDWLGTFLVQRENTGTGKRFMNEHTDPVLERLLVRTKLPMQGGDQRAYVPASLDAKKIIGLADRIEAMEEYHDSAFRAFLTLSDVNAAAPNLIESFHESYVDSWSYMEDAVRELCELEGLEDELKRVTGERGLPEEAVTIDYEVIRDHVQEAYDIVSEGWQVHAFSK
ncbi:hypothetical protein [Microbacterium capsulatum]|uniref:Uncharacterized protein n=1 Tax=Microbacterium capsulatum TaxID=3041921 RepID=A0ABU0XI03_9MICO|nr:hypothetical protein [Microbacterium sp. ASV81]MDQ4214766.1 hypothetical protein [Microbacterium sp. ASV81]